MVSTVYVQNSVETTELLYYRATLMACRFPRRLVEKALGKCWPKVFQNCRSTRQTELDRDHPSHIVANWLGNSVQVAKDFYLQTTEDDFAKANQQVTSKALQKAQQQVPAVRDKAVHQENADTKKAEPCETLLSDASASVPVRGLEPPRGCPQRILNPSRLPIPPHRRVVQLHRC